MCQNICRAAHLRLLMSRPPRGDRTAVEGNETRRWPLILSVQQRLAPNCNALRTVG